MTWVQSLISLALAVQTIELLLIQNMNGGDPWASQRPSNRETIFQLTLMLRLGAALLGVVQPTQASLGILLITSVVLAYRYRGHFNGASDAMSVQVVLACLVASIWPQFDKACLVYIAIQCVLSYFVAGLSKARYRAWFTGEALTQILKYSNATQPGLMRDWLLKHSSLIVVLSVGVILFECLFPMVIFVPQLVSVFIGLGIIFHLGNFLLFGLNRFFFVWLSTYPALFLAF